MAKQKVRACLTGLGTVEQSLDMARCNMCASLLQTIEKRLFTNGMAILTVLETALHRLIHLSCLHQNFSFHEAKTYLFPGMAVQLRIILLSLVVSRTSKSDRLNLFCLFLSPRGETDLSSDLMCREEMEIAQHWKIW